MRKIIVFFMALGLGLVGLTPAQAEPGGADAPKANWSASTDASCNYSVTLTWGEDYETYLARDQYKRYLDSQGKEFNDEEFKAYLMRLKASIDKMSLELYDADTDGRVFHGDVKRVGARTLSIVIPPEEMIEMALTGKFLTRASKIFTVPDYDYSEPEFYSNSGWGTLGYFCKPKPGSEPGSGADRPGAGAKPAVPKKVKTGDSDAVNPGLIGLGLVLAACGAVVSRRK